MHSRYVTHRMKLDIINEGFELLDKCGLQAFLDLTATAHDHDKGIRQLNILKEHFLGEEDYRKCAKIQDCINVLWVDAPHRQGLKKELNIL